MLKIILREDLIKKGENPQFKTLISFNNEEIDWTIPYEGWQPETWKDEQFNMLLFLPEGGLLRIIGEEFDYVPQTRTVVWKGGENERG